MITKSNLGGAQRYVLDLAIAMQSSYDVSVACGPGGPLIDRLEAAGVNVIKINHFQRDVSLLKEVRAFFELHHAIKHVNPDVIHLNSTKAGVIGALVAKLTRVPLIVFTAHGWPYLEPRNTLFRLLTWLGSFITTILSDQTIVVSHNDSQNAPTKRSRESAPVIHTAVPTTTLPDRTTARHNLYPDVMIANHIGDFWLVSLAELNYNKNILFAIQAVIEHNLNHERKIFYTILGDGVLMEKLQSYVKLNGAENYIKLLGYTNDAAQQLNGFDGFLLPSKKEGLPYALLEAGAAGLPAIASAVGGIPEVITNQESGWLINPDDQSGLEAALAELVSDREKREEYAHNLKQNVAANFTLTDMLIKTRTVYDNSIISRT